MRASRAAAFLFLCFAAGNNNVGYQVGREAKREEPRGWTGRRERNRVKLTGGRARERETEAERGRRGTKGRGVQVPARRIIDYELS